ncbi:hypothetical protein G647_04383 [Cladophialophora carrionii CBS 160.54]|uniref:Late sexual development protein n=1 Tax=Cladophialophora carrionii CBS 160.54 TaxID=1279043 RepID=V9DFA8_9EURO|nr:uncharacterized protein G647_04383 [Cladophialophora carrionii CBS 160.54]ETI25013.1 hypothetical protein G647_04383 [Cladophialophora carrionii CBS 160.54]
MHFTHQIGCQFAAVLAFTVLAKAAPQVGSLNNTTPGAPSSIPTLFPVGANGPNAPVVFPLSNGFPNIANNTPAFQALTVQAHGSISNAPPPPSLAADDLRSLKVVQLQETFEVYYFTQLLLNITNNVPGFEISDPATKADIVAKLTVIQGQEQWHALQAGGVLRHFNVSQIQPCMFKSSATDFASAISLAANFTAVVISSLQDVAVRLGQNGDSGVIRGIVSTVGQEGEQQGVYRTLLQDLVPADQPFLTQSTREFAYSALQQNFIVPGTCPNDNTIDVPIFGTLNVLTKNIRAVDQTLTFSIRTNSTQGLSLVYINQQNLPIVQTISNATSRNGMIAFQADFPFTKNNLNGLTIAAVTNSSGPFINANDVANKTLFGPGLIYPN